MLPHLSLQLDVLLIGDDGVLVLLAQIVQLVPHVVHLWNKNKKVP